MVHPCRRLHQATAKRYCDFEKESKFVSEFAWEGVDCLFGGVLWVWFFVLWVWGFFAQIPAMELPFCDELASDPRPWSVSGVRP